MRNLRSPMVSFLLLFWHFYQNLVFCLSLNEEGKALLAFKDKVEDDPYCALSNWDEGDANPCSWRGVECSEDGGVVTLDLRNFSLKGTLTPELGKLIGLKTLILHNNSFYGPFPGEITKLQKLEIVDLRYNNINEPVADALERILSLQTLNFESSAVRRVLQGKIPINSEPLTNSPTTESPPASQGTADQQKGKPSPPPTSPSPSPPPPPSAPSPTNHNSELSQAPTSSNKKKTWIICVVIGAPIFVVVSFVLFLIFYRASKVANVMPWRTGLSGQLQKAFVTGVPSLRRSEIEAACEDFSNIIGSLTTCSLYKGTLSNGVEIAVMSTLITSPKDWSAQHEHQFRKKISVLSTVNHKNFMNLIGYCGEEEPFTRMMVFEYAPNGTLFEHLHVKEAEQLDWAARLRIAMGIIYCLQHIEQLNPPVTIRNLNSSSVYVTEDCAAKVSDLELCQEGETAKTVPQSSDHENLVFKFGIILLEIISGRLPSSSDDDDMLVLWASDYLKGQRPLKDMVDPALVVRDEEISALVEVIKLCIHADPEEMPTAVQVAGRMRQITAITPEDASPKLSPLWWAELEIISS